MVESMQDLKKICLPPSAEEETKLQKIIYRRISIRVTRLFLHTNISANHVTFLSLLLGITAGILLINSDWRAIVGALLLFFSAVFDCVDGEIARYRKSSSLNGVFLDMLSHRIVNPFVIICLTFSVYELFHDIRVFYFGFSALLSEELAIYVRQSSVLIAERAKLTLSQGVTDRTSNNSSGEQKHASFLWSKPATPLKNLRILRTPFSESGRPPFIILVSLFDAIIPWAVVGSFRFNLVYLYLMVGGTGVHITWFLPAFQRIWRTLLA